MKRPPGGGTPRRWPRAACSQLRRARESPFRGRISRALPGIYRRAWTSVSRPRARALPAEPPLLRAWHPWRGKMRIKEPRESRGKARTPEAKRLGAIVFAPPIGGSASDRAALGQLIEHGSLITAIHK